jgi:hypothetical protein
MRRPFDDSKLPDPLPVAPLFSIPLAHPYPAYARLRARSPVFASPWAGLVLITGWAEAQAALKDPRLYRVPPARGVEIDPAHAWSATLADSTMLFANPPHHGRLRSFMSRAFQPRVIEGLRPRLERMVDQLLKAAARRGEMDLIGDLAQPLPVRAIAEMIGVPKKEWDRCVEWSGHLTPTIAAVITAAQRDAAQQVTLEFGELLRKLTHARRKRPQDDLLTQLVKVRDAGGELTEDELVANLMTLFVAGHETTTHLIGNAIVLLAQHPEARGRVEADPALLERWIEETLRYESPIQLGMRIASEDLEILGHPVARGSSVWAMIGAANRDPRRFEDPDRFSLDRDPNPHLAFGAGIHYCLGAALARLEGEVVLGAFVRRFKSWRLDGSPLEWVEGLTLRGFKRIGLEL